MASSPKLISLIFLLTTLIFSSQTHARYSQFFSKVTRNRDPVTTTIAAATTTNNALKQNELSTLTKQEDQEEEEPIFIPQTTGTGYGLYGHETGLDPPSTATTGGAATTPALYNMDNNAYENQKNYVAELKGLSEFNNNDNNNNNYHYNRNYKNYRYRDAGYNGAVDKQGMSDTRFLENGKYYYDLNTKKKNYGVNYMPYTNNYNGNYKNNYKNNGYYGNGENNYEEFYNNNNGNSMQGYQNQIPEEEEFDFDP